MSTVTASQPGREALFRYVLRLGDTSLVLGQRLAEWVGHSPALEEDLGLANLSLDLVGQARLLLTYAGEIEGQGRDEDALAFLREPEAFVNLTLAEQPNGDFGRTVVRQFLVDAWQLDMYEGLLKSSDSRLAGIAAKAIKETGATTIAVGLINDPNDAEMILETGEADLIAFARGALEDPNWPIHAHHILDGGEYDLWPKQARERIRAKDRALVIRQA